jgi:TRAP-type C4-dicarboxylate transport system permease small subunit
MKALLSIIYAIDNVLAVIIKPIVVVLSFCVAAMLVIGIVSRSFLGTPFFGLEELILASVMWLYMLGAALASRERTHLSGDFIQAFVSNKKIVTFFHYLASVISLIMACFFVSWSYDLAHWAVQKGQTTIVFGIPWYISQSSLFIASILMVFYSIRDLIEDFYGQPNPVSSSKEITS